MRKLMVCLSFCWRGWHRLLALFPDWFGADKVQSSLIMFGSLLIVFGVFCEIAATVSSVQIGGQAINRYYFNFGTNRPFGHDSETTQDVRTQNEARNTGKYFFTKVGSLILISMGTSILAAGVIFKVTQRKNPIHESLERAGVLFVGDRFAFDEVIGWDNWINETHRCSDLIIIGKDQIKWAEDSAEALSRVLSRDIDVIFIFQGEHSDESLGVFWETLKQKDPTERFEHWRKNNKLQLCTNKQESGDYGYYWNGEKLIVKLYFGVENKRQAPLIAFTVRFASGKFDETDFSAGSGREHIPFGEKKRMLFQAGLNIYKIKKGAKVVPLPGPAAS